uniref:Chitin-binding type-2 domain-containing protein n=1 Tax=Musca domestica TaxID=7370 RepID=A0A1I8MJM6_MUSDO
MVEAKKLALILLGIYVVIVANFGIVNGNVVTTTLDPWVSDVEPAVTTEPALNEPVTDEQPAEVPTTETPVETTPATSTESVTECVCDCRDQGRECDNTTTNPSGDLPAATTEATAENDPSTNVPKEETETTTPSNAEEVTSTTAPPPPPCNTPGAEADPSDCRVYHDCTATGSADGGFHLLTKFCASNEAYSVKLGRCSRDISSCPNDVVCQVKGGVADPVSNTSYYLCEPRLIGGGFHVFHVQCSANQVFYPLLGKCFLDLENLPAAPAYPGFPPYYWNPFEDIDIVKAELKLIKEQDKLTLKLEKELLKAEKKRQKELQKEAELRAKQEEKLKKELLKQESATFVCPQDGTYPSTVSETAYFVCVSKKGKSKVSVVQCPVGSKFNADIGFCAIDQTLLNQALSDVSVSVDDEDDD